MAKTLADMKAAMQKELEEEQKRLEREEGKRFSSSQTSGNSSSGKTSNNTQSSAQSSAAAAQAKANKEADLIGAKDSKKLNETTLENRDKKKKKTQEEKSLVGNLVEAASLDQKAKTEKGITLENRDEIKAQKQKEYFEDAKEPFQNIIENAKNDKEIKERVNPQNREEIREEKREDVWKSKEDDSDAETLLKGLGNRARSVPGKLIQSTAEAFYDITDDTVKGYEEGDKISLENRDAAKAAKIKENSAWFLDPAREKAAEVAAGNKAEGVSAMATEQLDKLRAKTDNALVQDLISAADGGATMLGYMALPFGTKYLSLYMGASQAVDTYNEGRANGQSKEEAAARGITDGAISMAVESIGGVGKIPGLNAAADVVEAAAAKNFISNLAMQAFQEGGEGFAEAVLSYVGNVVNDLIFKGEIQTSFSFSEALHNAFVEGLSGAMFGAGSFGVAKISGVPGLDASLSEVSQDIIAGVKSVLNIDQTKANPPEALIKAKPPVPFEGTAEPGTEAGIVADKISEIENRPISEAEKAAKIEEVMEAVAETTQSQEAINEAGKVAEFYKNRQAEFDEAVEIGKKLGISVELDPNIAGNGIHTTDGRIIINPNTENPALQVFVHELTHDIESSGLYESFSKKILEHASQIGLDVNKIRAMVIEDYKAAGHDLTDTQADAEIVAKYCEQHLFTDEKAIDRLLSEDRSLFQKIKDWISDMIVKFKGAPEEKFLLEAERLYEKALATRGEVSGIDSEAESVGRGFDEMAAKARDQEYSAAIETGDMETAQRLTDEAAKAAGYNSPLLYHGTYRFGFTEFDLSKMDDGASIFLTDNPRVASTYSGVEGKRDIGKKTVNNLSLDDMAQELNKHPGGMPQNFKFSVFGQKDYSELETKINNQIEEIIPQVEKEIENFAEKLAKDFDYADFLRHANLRELKSNLDSRNYKRANFLIDDLLEKIGVFEDLNVRKKLQDFAKNLEIKNEYEENFILGNSEILLEERLGENEIRVFPEDSAKHFFDRYYGKGNYGLYADLGKILEVDAQGQYWDEIEGWAKSLPEEKRSVYSNKPEQLNTRTIAEIARQEGYDSVVFKGIIDIGGQNPSVDDNEQGNVYVIFDPNRAKSADPVTYDDDGNVIPLSERFKPEEKDFRYSTGRSFDEMAGEAKAEHGVSEGISVEISDSAKRVVEQMKERPSVQKSIHEFEQREAEIEPVKVPQSKKSERIEKRYQKAVEDGVASVFGIDRKDIKNDIRPILNEIAADVKDGKTITDEQIDALYKQAFDDGYISEEFPQYQEIRKYVREKPFYVSPETRHEFGDDEAFREFARENFGNFKVSTDPRNRSLDDFYKTMAEMAPEFFTEGETDPRTQLEDISDFMNQTKKQYFGLSEVYSGTELADFESWAKKELKAYMNEFGKGLDNVRRYELDRQIKATNKAREMDTTASFEQAKAAFEGNRVFEAQKAVEKAKQNQLLNDMDNLTVKKLLEGTINEADVIALGGNVEGILEVYNAEKAYKAARAPFDKYKAAYKTALQHDAIELTTLSDEFTDKKIGAAYSRETAERNVKDIAGKSAGKIIEEYFTPVHENEAMKTRWIKDLNQRVADLELGRMNRWERAYAQMIGENAAYIAEGRMTKHDQNEHDVLNERISALLDKHGKKIDKAKCEKAAAGLMGIYEDILEEWNDERIRRGQEPVGKIQNYFPHFTETRPENTIQKIFSFFGFDIGNSKLPTDIAGRTADRKPQSKYNPHAQRRTTDVTDYDIFKGFDGYVRAVGDNIFHTEDIQKLRTLSDTIRTKYSSAEIEKRIEEIRNRDDLSEADKETLIADTFKSEPGAYHLSNFVVWLDEYTNILAGKKSRGDREAEYQMGREIYDITKALEGRIASNMIGYNLSTPVMNFVPMFQAVADVPPQDILSSFVQTGLAAAKGDSFISDNSDFLTNRFGVDSVYKKNYGLFTSENVKDAFAKISDGGGLLMEFVDRIVSESLVRARYEQNIKKGMDKVSAFSEADGWAAGLIADRSTGALPTVFNIKNPVAKSLTMFQVEANNQYSYIFKDAGKYKWKTEGAFNTITGQIAFWIAMRICNGLAEEFLGRDNVVPDPIGLTYDAIKKIVEGEPVGNVLLDTGIAAVEQLPFVGGLLGGGRIPLSTALPDLEQSVKLFNPEISGDKKKQILVDELTKPLSYFFLPSGAGQIWKTGKGVKQLIEGGAFGMENDGSVFMKFPQEYDPESVIKTLLFGQYASDRGQEYIDSNFRSLSAKDTANMELASQYNVSNKDFYDTILGLKEFKTKEEKQEALLQNENLDAREKGVIDWILFGDGKGFPEATRDYTSEQAFWESGLSDSEIRLNEDGYNREEIRLIEYAFEKGKDKVSTIEWIQKTMDCTEAEAYEIYQRRQGKWIDDPGKLPAEEQARAKGAAELYGMSEENFLNVLNYSNFGVVKDGEYSNKKEDVIKQLMKANSWSKEKAEELYNRVNLYEYSREDLEDAKVKELQTSQEWYGVNDKGYFVARNVIKTAEGTTDKYGNTVSGSVKEAAVKEIAEQLGVDETEATVYYLAAKGELALSKSDLTTSQREDLDAAKKEGWTERQYLDAVNLLKVSGATKKDDIIKTLMDGGATYEMAQGYYNLRQNKDYDRAVSTGSKSFSYGMKNQKQADKGDYFLANYNSDGSLSAKDITKWFAAAAGCNKKQEYLDAYQSAGATYSQALKFYNLMRGYDKNFNSYYKQKG
ncbi:MAG: hypothetical protein IIW81_05240 [Oscillospiraceae bacterium]|nr:hypothetical protein [Oscillospiraceae bacterium]